MANKNSLLSTNIQIDDVTTVICVRHFRFVSIRGCEFSLCFSPQIQHFDESIRVSRSFHPSTRGDAEFILENGKLELTYLLFFFVLRWRKQTTSKYLHNNFFLTFRLWFVHICAVLWLILANISKNSLSFIGWISPKDNLTDKLSFGQRDIL